MAKQFFKNLPDTSTPLTATRFNGLLDGGESQGNLVVDSIRTKNMFDSSTFIQGDITNAFPTIRMSSRQILWLEPGTYTFSTNQTSSYQFAILVQNAGIPPLSTQPTLIYNRTWADSNNDTFTLQTGGWITIYLRKSDNTAFSTSDISNLLNFNYQLEKGSAITTYRPYQNLDGKDTVIQTTATINSSYISTIDANKVTKTGNVVQLVFRGYVSNSIPNNTPFINVPYAPVIGSANFFIAAIGTEYSYTDLLWGYITGNKTVQTNAVSSGKWIHINTTYITND